MSKPDYRATTPTEYENAKGKQTLWTNIGSAFKSEKGDSITVLLNALPVNGKIVLIVPKDDEQKPQYQKKF
jgi:hypothetical protein